MKKELPKNIVNPFSEEFLQVWGLWKDFRWEQHKFKYKGCISEQAALMRLTTTAGGKEETAIAVIHQSIANGWKDFYMIKDNSNGTTKADTRKDVSSVIGSRSY
jgi:hypothetical protein